MKQILLQKRNKSATMRSVPTSSQPLIGQNLTGELARSYPTPGSDIDLTAITEGNITDYLQTLYGTPPPENTNAGHMLVSETPIDWKFFRRRYVTDRTNEDIYNASISYEGENTDYPTFTRDYIVRRSVYTPKGKLTALSGIINARVTNGGSGYSQSTVSVSLSGGTGSGGAVTAIVSNGVVTMLVITAEGNYTAAPTVTINGGTGATGTVEIQPQSAKLVKEDYIRMQGNELDGLFVLIRRIYMTLPGPNVWSPGFNTDLGAATSEYRQLIQLPAQPTALGTVITNPFGADQVVYDGRIEPLNGSIYVGTKITECITLPPGRTEYESIGYEFPAQFEFLTGWVIPASPFHVEGPYPGVNFTLTAHRVLSTPAETSITYTNGPSGLVGVVIYFVVTPGRADRFFGIGPNTIHNAIFLQETVGAGTLTVEDLPASDPTSYTPGDVLVIRASERKLMGTIYEQRVTSCHE